MILLLIGLGCQQNVNERDLVPQKPDLANTENSVRSSDDPHNKFLLRAVSDDGLTWEKLPGHLADAASSPCLVMIDNKPRVYYVADGHYIAWIPFEGGKSKPVSFDGIKGLTVDPHLVAFKDGYRMYFIHQEEAVDPGRMINRVLSAKSSDGNSWNLEEGVRIEGRFVDPDVINVNDGWRMYYTQDAHQVMSAWSNDGLTFELEPGVRMSGGGVTSVTPDGTKMYYHSKDRIYIANSEDGLSFLPSDFPILLPGDEDKHGMESPTVSYDGSKWLMVYASKFE